VILPPQRAVTYAAFVGSLGVIAIVAGLALLDYTRYERAKGFVAARSKSLPLVSPFVGSVNIESIFVEPGDVVVVGAPVVQVEGEKVRPDPMAAGRTNTYPKRNDSQKGGLENAILFSTVGGRVEKVFARLGSGFGLGDPLATVRPVERAFRFEVLVNGRTVAHLRPGEVAIVEVEAFPVQRFIPVEGRIASISDTSLSPPEVSMRYGVAAPSEGMFVVVVEISPSAQLRHYHGLRDGMAVEVAIPMERMSMLSWIFRSVSERGRATIGP
jgi:Tfp pilus assembly major pilin PilA